MGLCGSPPDSRPVMWPNCGRIFGRYRADGGNPRPVWYFIGAIAAVLLGTGFVLQQDAAQRVPQAEFLRPRLVADLLRQRRWLAGLGLMIAGMLLSGLVIGHMVLALSEPLLATNLLVALVIAGRLSGQRYGPASWSGR